MCARTKRPTMAGSMSSGTDFVTSEREAITQYADWYSQQGYQVSVHPSPSELPEFLRTLAPDLVARRNGGKHRYRDQDLLSGELRTSTAAGQGIGESRRLEAASCICRSCRSGMDPAPGTARDSGTFRAVGERGQVDGDDDRSRLQFLLLWSIIEGAARHHLSSLKIPPTRRISSSALLKMLLTEGIIEEDRYAVLRRGLAGRNAIAHGFLNQTVDPALLEELRNTAGRLLRSVSRK